MTGVLAALRLQQRLLSHSTASVSSSNVACALASPWLRSLSSSSQKPDSSSATSSSSGSAPAPSTSPSTRQATDEEWTEVVDQASGQTYYWNQQTGETTQLGEPKPGSRFRDERYQGAGQQSGPFQEGWREPPERDHTAFYSFVGVVVGVTAGWATQYMH